MTAEELEADRIELLFTALEAAILAGDYVEAKRIIAAALEAARRERAKKDALLAEGALLPIAWGSGTPAEFDAIQRTRNGIADAIRQATAEKKP